VYETFEHTADLGLRVRSADLDCLFREAAEGLFSVLVEAIPQNETVQRADFELEAERTEFLLVDWLNELLYRFETRGLLFDSFDVRLDGNRLMATAQSRRFDEQRDRILHEVKAVTYHDLQVRRTDQGWLAELILDI
jgi:SHS2 domain-containing protein